MLTTNEVIRKYKISRGLLFYLRIANKVTPEIRIENGRIKHYYTQKMLDRLFKKEKEATNAR